VQVTRSDTRGSRLFLAGPAAFAWAMTSVDAVLVCARLGLAAVFLVSAAAKIVDLRGAMHAVAAFGAPRLLARPIGVLLPIVECGIALLLASATLNWWGATAAIGLLLAFTVAITVSLARGKTPPCHCFGQFHAKPIGWSTVVRNAVIALPAGVILVLSDNRSGRQTSLMSVVVIAGALILAGFIGRKIWGGREKSDADVVEGLPMGAPAPPFRLPTPTGRTVALERLICERALTALVFSEPACPECRGLASDIARWQSQYATTVTIVLITRSGERTQDMPTDHGRLDHVLLQQGWEIAEQYKVPGTPGAVLVRREGTIASLVALGRPAIEKLLASAIER